ncbi:MAG: galactose oxidase [Planctomycetota bacterium]
MCLRVRAAGCTAVFMVVTGLASFLPPADGREAVEENLPLTGLPSLPDVEGFAGGFLGLSGDHLLFAGGANFPGKKPWEGGTKVWSADVFALPLSVVRAAAEGAHGGAAAPADRHQWQRAGQLAAPRGYGVSATFNDELLLVGGSSAQGHSSQVTGVRLSSGRLELRTLPALPLPLANHCGTLVGSTVYVFGGQTAPASLAESSGWQLDLSEANSQWSPLPKFPGPARILAAAAVVDGQLWVVGGAKLSADANQSLVRTYLSDAWKLDPRHGWVRVPDVTAPCVAAPSPLPLWGSHPLLLGGDDGSQVSGNPLSHRGFPRMTQRFLKAENRWLSGPNFLPAVVTAPTVSTGFGTVIVSGEIRPGIRSPAAWLLLEESR